VKQDKPKYRKVKRISKNLDKKEQVNQLVLDLDNVFSIFIRQRGMDENGINQCYTCKKFDHWKSLQCGHYLSRKHFGTRFEEKNCFPQCKKCNLYTEGNKPAYSLNLIKDFGLQYLDELEILKNRLFKKEVFNLQLLIKHYQSLIKK